MIYDAKDECHFKGKKLIFDTNVWISIYGNDPRSSRLVYSNYYSSVLKSDNTIVINDYILGEYFNRACRLEYIGKFPEDVKYRDFKKIRVTSDFQECMESIRDTCLNIIDETEYQPTVSIDCSISDWISEASLGSIDFSDIAIREHCLGSNLVLVSHDADFAQCGFDFVTGNAKVLTRLGKQ